MEKNIDVFRRFDIEGSTDPQIRSLSILLNQTCEKTQADLQAIADDLQMPAGMPIVLNRYMLRRGFVRQKQPRKPDGKRYTVWEWLMFNPPMDMLITVAKHTTCARDCRQLDVKDCSARVVTGCWVRREDVTRLVERDDAMTVIESEYRSDRVWDRAAICREIAVCDEMTGLRGKDLPIEFITNCRSLGRFSWSKSQGGRFQFNVDYFDDPTFPVEEAIDTIRHEYAHYIDREKFGKHGHGATWKKACRMVGANPSRFYSEENAKRHRQQHLEEQQRQMEYRAFCEGLEIVHPRFGTGSVLKINSDGGRSNLDVDFAACGVKKLGMGWVREHCAVHAG